MNSAKRTLIILLCHVTKHPRVYVDAFLTTHAQQGTLTQFLDGLGDLAHKSVFRVDATRPLFCCFKPSTVCRCSGSTRNGVGPLTVPVKGL